MPTTVKAGMIELDEPIETGEPANNIIEAGSIQLDEQSQSQPPPTQGGSGPPSLPRTLWNISPLKKNIEAVGNIPGNIVRVAQPFLHPIQTVEGVDLLAQGLGRMISPSLIPKRASTPERNIKADIAAKTEIGRVKDIVNRAIEDPLGVPQRVMDWGVKNPVDVGLLASGGLNMAAKGAVLLKAPKLATEFIKASEIINPISLALKVPRTLLQKPLSALGESIMARVLKIPPGRLNQAVRKEVTQTIIREGLPINNKTVNKIKETTAGLEKNITGSLTQASKGGSKINVDSALNNLENLKAKYDNTLSPGVYHKAIDNAKIELINHDFMDKVSKSKIIIEPSAILGPNGKPIMVPKITNINVPTGEVDILKGHLLKKGIYKEIQKFYMDRNRPAAGTNLGNKLQAGNEAKAEIARTLREEILKHPDVPASVKADLQREASIVNAQKWVELATNRGGNHDPISLGSMAFGIMVEKGLPSAAAWRIAMSQPLLSRFAILSDRIGRRVGSISNFGAKMAPEVSLAVPFLKEEETQ